MTEDMRSLEKKAKIAAIKDMLFPERDMPDQCDVCGKSLMRVGHGKGEARAKGVAKLIDGFDIWQWYLCDSCSLELLQHLEKEAELKGCSK